MAKDCSRCLHLQEQGVPVTLCYRSNFCEIRNSGALITQPTLHHNRQANRDFKQIAMAGANIAAGRRFSPKWDTTHVHVRWLHPAIVSNLTTRVAMFCRSGWLLRRVYFASLALFNGHLGILRIPLDTISFKVNLSQGLCQGSLP